MSLVQNDTGERMAAEREGFYEKTWKDFVSLQRGDAKQICVEAARYRWLKENRDVMLLTSFFGNGCINRTLDEVDAAIDAAMTANVEFSGGAPLHGAASAATQGSAAGGSEKG